MAWLRKATLDTRLLRGPQTIPAWNGALSAEGNGPPKGMAFLDQIGMNEALYPEPNFVNNVAKSFDKNELVYACVMEIATSLPEAPFRIYGPDGMGEARENHPLRQLIKNPNPCTTEFEMMELTSMFLDLCGIAFWEIVVDRLDRPVELWPLRPDRVRIFPKQNGEHEYGYALDQEKIWPLGTNVIAFKLPNPMNPNMGQAPMRSANRAVALDNEATDFVKTLLQNRAVPGTVIETEQEIDQTLVDRLTVKWIERFGKNNRGKPAFMQKGMTVHPLGLDLGQLEFPDLRTISESRICMCFGVPPILVGAKVGLDRSTFANYREARSSFWEETLMPRQQRMQQTIVAKLLPMFEGPRPRRVVGRFDNSQVRALRESEANRWEKGTAALRAGGIQINDFLRYIGLPMVEGGNVFLIPAGVTPVENPSQMPEPVATPAAPPASPDESGATGDESDATDEGKGLTLPPSSLAVRASESKASKAPVPASVVDAFARAVAEVVQEQHDEILEQVDKSKALLSLAPAMFKANLWDRSKWNRRLATAIEPHMHKVAFTAGRRVASDQDPEAMDGYIHAAAARTAKDWNAETEAQVGEVLRDGGTDVGANVVSVFALAAGHRALTMARTASTEMNGFAKVDTAKRAGIPNKTWVVTSGNPRPEHEAMDGETVPVNEPFSDGSDWPGGPNCQCDVEFTSEGI